MSWDMEKSNIIKKASGRAIIIHPELPSKESPGRFRQTLEEKLEEARGLAHAIFLEVADLRAIKVSKPSPGYLIGKGNREEIGRLAESLQPDVIIVNHSLTPVQQRNLERAWECKVIDRTGLILEIFGERANTREGRIQVDLAALEYQRSRLVRSWTHLERQRGGAGFMGGPGETQIEIDRRIIGDKIAKLKKDLEQVRRNRDLQRRSRERVPFPIVALVGYTNAGKSTLFNKLTGATVYAEDLPFATLDPTMRKATLASGQEVILSDTVGFITDLPMHLVAAFRATLEQLQYADVILHILDIAQPDHKARKQEVVDILNELGIQYEKDERIIEVWNKIDSLPVAERESVKIQTGKQKNLIAVSALTGEGAEALLSLVEKRLSAYKTIQLFLIPASDGKALAWLHEHANVLEKTQHDGRMQLRIEIDPADSGRFTERFSYKPLSEKNEKKQFHGSEH